MIGLCAKLNQIKFRITSVDMSKWVAYSFRSEDDEKASQS